MLNQPRMSKQRLKRNQSQTSCNEKKRLSRTYVIRGNKELGTENR